MTKAVLVANYTIIVTNQFCGVGKYLSYMTMVKFWLRENNRGPSKNSGKNIEFLIYLLYQSYHVSAYESHDNSVIITICLIWHQHLVLSSSCLKSRCQSIQFHVAIPIFNALNWQNVAWQLSWISTWKISLSISIELWAVKLWFIRIVMHNSKEIKQI